MEKKTKIIATIGPASGSKKKLRGKYLRNIKEARAVAREMVKKKKVGSKENHFVMCAGMPFSIPGTTNLVFVDEV